MPTLGNMLRVIQSTLQGRGPAHVFSYGTNGSPLVTFIVDNVAAAKRSLKASPCGGKGQETTVNSEDQRSSLTSRFK